MRPNKRQLKPVIAQLRLQTILKVPALDKKIAKLLLRFHPR